MYVYMPVRAGDEGRLELIRIGSSRNETKRKERKQQQHTETENTHTETVRSQEKGCGRRLVLIVRIKVYIVVEFNTMRQDD